MTRERSDVPAVDPVSDELSRLRAEHRELEARLEELDREVYLTPDEQFERKRIQKLKLQKKDRIHRLTRPSR